jgi:hypothetical protein
MLYVVIELQKNGDSIANIVTTHETRNEADSKFFSVLSAAAISTVEKHACSLLTEDGICIRSEAYEHSTEEPNEG